MASVARQLDAMHAFVGCGKRFDQRPSTVFAAVIDVVQALLDVTEGTSLTLDSLQLAFGEIIAGAGLIAARDANKSSQDSSVR